MPPAPVEPASGRGAWPLLGLLLLVTLGLGHVAAGWRTDNRPTLWIREGPDAERYARFVERFGSDETLRVRLQDADAELAREVADELERRVGPSGQVIGPWSIPGGDDPARPLTAALELLGPDHVDLLVALDHEASPEERAEVARALVALAERVEARGGRLSAAGHPLVAAALDAEALKVEHDFVPLLVLFTWIVMALVLRSPRAAGLIVLVASMASLGTRAALATVGWDANLVLVAAGPLVLVLTSASSLHLVSAFRRLRAGGLAPAPAAREARRQVLPAALLAALTTALGFGVFATSSITPVARLGLVVAGATLVGVPAAYLVLPPLVARFAAASGGGGTWGRFVRRRAKTAVRYRGVVLALTLAVLAGGAWAALTLDTATSALDYFPRSHPIRAAFLDFEQAGTALTTVEVLAENVELAPATSEVEARLAEVPGVEGVIGPETVWRDLRAQLGPAAGLALAAALRRTARRDEAGETWRWTVRTRTGPADELARLDADLEAAARAALGPGAAIEVTGSIPAVLAMQAELVDTLARSLVLTLVVVLLLFLTVVRSVRAMVAVLLTNLLPVAGVLAASGLLGWRLDAATTMVAAVVLGLAVDNTLHLLAAGRRPDGTSTPWSRLRAFSKVGEAAWVSTLALAAGFGCLGVSGFAPTAHFGTLVALGTLFALLADLAVLPALWVPSPRGARAPAR